MKVRIVKTKILYDEKNPLFSKQVEKSQTFKIDSDNLNQFLTNFRNKHILEMIQTIELENGNVVSFYSNGKLSYKVDFELY